MTEALIGIIVGTTVALIAQVLAYVFAWYKERREARRRGQDVTSLLRHEIQGHRSLYRHHLAWAEASIEKGGPEHTGYSYERATTRVYDQVFMTHWHTLPDDLIGPVSAYYAQVETFNTLSGSFGTPTPVPIREAKAAIERALAGAEGVLALLERHVRAR